MEARPFTCVPEPCVPVATAPATEMWGKDAIVASAQPWRVQFLAQGVEGGCSAHRGRVSRLVDPE